MSFNQFHLKEPNHVLMVSPEEFTIIDEKNIHMKGMIESFNKSLAVKQWNNLKSIYDALKNENVIQQVHVMTPIKGCEDMVFTANQSLPFYSEDGKKKVIISNMKHASRQREIPSFIDFYSSHGYEIIPTPPSIVLEGMGDVLKIPGTNQWLGGYGHRTEIAALEWLDGIFEHPVIQLELVSPYFYHLDTCLIPVNENTALYCPLAFHHDTIQRLKKSFINLIEIPSNEALKGFALNAHLIQNNNQKHAIIQQGNTYTENVLKELGFNIHSIDTSEFMKSGGSVFCMKMMCY
jgi:N-dimethylarginine dimethylaminohydrolase